MPSRITHCTGLHPRTEGLATAALYRKGREGALALAATVALGCLAGCWPPLDEVSNLTVSESYRAVVLADAPLAYWPLDEQDGAPKALDATANHHDAQYLGNVTFGPGPIAEGGRAASFDEEAVNLDGKCTRIVVGDVFDFPGDEEFTIEAWIKPRAVKDEFRRIFAKAIPASNGPQDGYELDTNQSAKGLVFQRSASNVVQAGIYDVPAPSTTAFTHVVLTSDGTQVTLFVNGVSPMGVGTSPFNGPAVATTVPFVWGASSTGERCFAGALAELAVYGTALSASRVAAHYRAGQGAP